MHCVNQCYDIILQCKEVTLKIEKYIQIKIYILSCYIYHLIYLKENLSDHWNIWEIIFCDTSIKLFIMRTILWIIKFSAIVHLCVNNFFSWWNSLFFFFSLKHQIDWYIKHTKYFWEFHVASIVDCHAIIKKTKTTTTENCFCHNCYQIWVSSLGLP